MKFLPSDKLLKNTVVTILSKTAILLSNFCIVVTTTHLWGSSGRGEIALVIANVAIISILCNITSGSTIVFHAPKENRDLLIIISITGSFVLSLLGSLIFSLTIGFKYFTDLFIISLLSSLTGSVSMYWLGKNNIKLYNFLTLINPVLVLFFILIFYFVFKITNIRACFYAYYAGLGLVLLTGIISLLKTSSFRYPKISFNDTAKVVKYGFNNEFNNLIQFLNYRLSYFFIAKWLGLSQLGVFSVAMSCAEGVWIISRSMSALHFSNVVNTKDQNTNISATKNVARQSFLMSLLFMGILTFLPRTLFEYIFGHEFGDIKIYLIYLTPGIIAIAVANLYDHYFSGVGKLHILIFKSTLGLIATILLLFLLTKKFQLTGVCISQNISYLLSFFYLFYEFSKEKGKSV